MKLFFEKTIIRQFLGTCWIERPAQLTLVRVVGRYEPLPDVPFGWALEQPSYDAAFRVGPAWCVLPLLWWRKANYNFAVWAVRRGLAAESCEGCLISELVWFPAQRWDR